MVRRGSSVRVRLRAWPVQGPKGPGPPTFPIPRDPAQSRLRGDRRLRRPRPTSRASMARYLYGDHCSTDVRSFIPNVNAQQAIDDSATGVTAQGVTGFGKGLAGQI